MNTIHIDELKQETCHEIFNNLHGEFKLGKKILVQCFVIMVPSVQNSEEVTEDQVKMDNNNNKSQPKSQQIAAPTAVVMSCSHRTYNCPCSNQLESEEEEIQTISYDKIIPMTSEDSDSDNESPSEDCNK